MRRLRIYSPVPYSNVEEAGEDGGTVAEVAGREGCLMANPSKRTPWVVQMYVKSVGLWVDLDAYRTQAEAEDRVAIIRQRQPETEWRVTSYVVTP